MEINIKLHSLITEKINALFLPTKFKLLDETHRHAKHKQFQPKKSHLKLIITSVKLNEMSKIKAHQAIYNCLGNLMETDIHALSIQIEN